jgi:hypothetical protein
MGLRKIAIDVFAMQESDEDDLVFLQDQSEAVITHADTVESLPASEFLNIDDFLETFCVLSKRDKFKHLFLDACLFEFLQIFDETGAEFDFHSYSPRVLSTSFLLTVYVA